MRAVIASILLLLVIVSVAHAECAWVLWLGTGLTYTPFGAYGGEHGRERLQGGGHSADDRHEQECQTTRRVPQVE